MPVDKSVINDLNKVIEKLEGWAETAARKIEGLSHSDAEPWVNMRDNYQALIVKLTDVVERLSTEVVEDIQSVEVIK